jgi:hypothetical protein
MADDALLQVGKAKSPRANNPRHPLPSPLGGNGKAQVEMRFPELNALNFRYKKIF